MELNKNIMEKIKKWREIFGITPNNPFASIAVILTVISAIVMVVLLYNTFAGTTARTRYHYAVALMFVSVFAQVPVALLIIYARNRARIQAVLAGDYWAHWQSPSEIYLCSEGIYNPVFPSKLDTFSYKLKNIEIPADCPSEIRFDYLNIKFIGKTSYGENKSTSIKIPEGKESEAQELVRRFQSRIGKPSQFMLDQWRIAAMMCIGIVAAIIFSLMRIIPLESEYKAEGNTLAAAENAVRQAKKVSQLRPILMPIRQVIDPQIEHLKTMPDGEMTAQEAGLDKNHFVSKVIYGHCQKDNNFYLSVVLKENPLKNSRIGALNYSTADGQGHRLDSCRPANQDYYFNPDLLGDGWYYAEFYNFQPTPSQSVPAATPK